MRLISLITRIRGMEITQFSEFMDTTVFFFFSFFEKLYLSPFITLKKWLIKSTQKKKKYEIKGVALTCESNKNHFKL